MITICYLADSCMIFWLFTGMQARLMLAALDWNTRLHERALAKDGTPKQEMIWSKRRKQWIIRSRYKNIGGQHLHQLVNRVLEVHIDKIALAEMEVPADLPAHVANVEKPAMDEDAVKLSRWPDNGQ